MTGAAGAAAGAGAAISRGGSIGGGPAGVAAGLFAVTAMVAPEDTVGGGTCGVVATGLGVLTATELEDAAGLFGGIVASARSARSKTAAAVSPRAAGGGFFATSLDWRTGLLVGNGGLVTATGAG